MGNESGTWIMHGISWEDPKCLHSASEMIEYINKIGFLPLFKNDIAGFSVEEHTDPAWWWSGNTARDPWEWRIIAARSGEVVYGKFFDRKAGFISKEWLPAFINLRRDGYDFDALWDDEKASLRQKKIMDLFETSGELFSNEIKAGAGFGKDGEKNFDGVITALQTEMYLCVRDFRQKKNRKGEGYGWPVAVYTKPENLLGYGAVTAAYSEDPAESGERIAAHLRKLYPGTDEKKIAKICRG